MQTDTQIRAIFNKKSVSRLAKDIQTGWPEFDRRGFERRIASRLDGLGFSERSDLITETLREFLPDDFPQAADILLRGLGPEIGGPDLSGSRGFLLLPQTMYVARYGLGHFNLSMRLLYEMTKRFTAEWAIRPFIRKYPEKTLRLLEKWTTDANPHVRRLVSEGTRPRLPWATRLPEFQADPGPVLTLLEKLKEDPELYVRRSVANNLNDIAKDHPDLVVATLQRWSRLDNPGTQWIIAHALRTLLKQGHPGALALQGYAVSTEVELRNIAVHPRRAAIGGETTLGFTLVSTACAPLPLLVDFVLHFVKSNGQRNPKVFKLTKRTLAPGESVDIEKRIPFRAVTTRKYYPGTHRVEVQVNGAVLGGVEFELGEEEKGDRR